MGKPRKNIGPASMQTDSHGTDDDDSPADTEDDFSNILNKKVKSLKRKIMTSKMRDDTMYHQHKKAKKQNVGTTVLTRYSGKLFSSVIRGLTPKQIDVIKNYGMECLLKFVKTDVPLRFVKWIASSFDTTASEIQLTKKFIPVTKQTIHNILDLPIGGIELVPDCEAGREFMLSHFKLTSIPSVNFFANKLISGEDLSDEDIFICFMSVAFTSFLCPNSSLLPSTQYFHIFKDCKNVRRYDLSKFVYDWLVTSIKNFKQATRMTSKRSITFGGCHYALAVSYLDSVEFGLNSLAEDFPRLLVWVGNRIRKYSEMDKISSNSYGKRPLKRLVPSSVYQVERSYGKDSCKKFPKIFSSPFNFNGKLKAMFSPFFTDEVLDDIAHIVHSNSIGKPKDFEIWSESLVCDVLKCLHHTQHDNGISISQKSIGNLFQFKFPQGMQENSTFKASHQDCPVINEIGNPMEGLSAGIHGLNTPQSNFQDREIPDIHSGTISKGKLASGKYQHFSKLISENKAPESLVKPAPGLAINQPNTTKHDIPASTTIKGPDVVDSFQVQSEPPTNKDKEKVKEVLECNAHAVHMNEGNGCVVDANVLVGQDVATADSQQRNEEPSDTIKQATKVLSPIVPIRLSEIFSEQGSENNYITIKDSPTTPSVANSKIQAVATHIAKKLIDLSSPVCDPQVLIIDDSISPEVKITGECNFKCKYETLSKETDEAYNKLTKYAVPTPNDACVQNTISQEGSKFTVYQQENTTYRSDNSIFKHSSNYQTPIHIEPNFEMPHLLVDNVCLGDTCNHVGGMQTLMFLLLTMETVFPCCPPKEGTIVLYVN